LIKSDISRPDPNGSRMGLSVELYIDHDKDAGQKNEAIFDALHVQKDSIEKDFGDSLEWERLDDKRACRIRKRFENGGLASPDSWPALQDAMIRFDKVLRPRLSKIEA
jgi:Domain of unknown function (DUF4268)